ncbi:NAD(P)-binding domain-containing protein [Sphaerisporangium fuscum]|uniref:NAD(P)-binding domain-containing protein n=1 Tax=Sphaerisporangium fuscum TaxID=2835868 RepID=UPI001BDCFA42|nr:NAD(P)-binding domain-containing protein [Sphaerisporangium fuscum]
MTDVIIPAPVVLDEARVRELLRLPDAIAVTRQALIAQAAGHVTQPDPWHLEIPQVRGEVHIKGGYLHGSTHFAAKLATGFYANSQAGIPVSSGLSVIADAQTGYPVVIALDNGYLTDVRTAAAGALASDALARKDADVVAVIGPGIQGALQLRALLELRKPTQVRVYGPNKERAEAFATRMRELHTWKVTVTDSVQQAVEGADIITTATPSRKPHLFGEWLKPGTHVTAIGADMDGKRELAASVLTATGLIAADDLAQCRRVGELQYATKTVLDSATVVALGDVLAGRVPGRTSDDQITVADLTGLGAEDAAVGTVIAQAVARSRPAATARAQHQ